MTSLRLQKAETARIESLKMWMTGATYRQIAEAMGCSAGTAYSRVQSALDDMRPHADIDRYRAVQIGEMEIARQTLRKMISRYGQPEWANHPETGARVLVGVLVDLDGCVKAITALLKLQEREAKLLGMDKAETPFDQVSKMSDAELEAWATAWAEEIRQKDAALVS